MKNEPRFIELETESSLLSSKKVIVDRLTGVNYLFIQEGSAGGLTVLLDEDGDPIVSDPEEYE